ncbi:MULTISPECIES: fibronectin type III domain-containing protein [Flavobacteriaceae]|uniref:fibronectin type III domain-containing protein n=1 Tax=Flavobacteriaceae TaxID=49546 RepID=UPI003A93F37A
MNGMMHHVSSRNILPEPNLFLGGVGVTITTATILAIKMGIDEDNIFNFQIDANDNISCYIDITVVGFSIISNGPVGGIYDTTTYVVDLGNVIGTITGVSSFQNFDLLKVFHSNNLTQISGGSVFRDINGTKALTTIIFPNLTTVSNTIVCRGSTSIEYVIFNECLTLGGGTFQSIAAGNMKRIRLQKVTLIGSSNSTAQGTFQVPSGTQIYVNPTMFTADGGSLEADLQQAIDTYSANVISIDDTTPPSAVSDLSASSITSSGCDLDFTPPSSTNALDFYEVWVENIDLDLWHVDRVAGRYTINQEITSSGDTITGLTTGTNYKIWIIACDEYWNRSEISNVIEITTL